MSARPLERTPALVVRLSDYGEADKIVGLFCRDRGLVSAIARSARRSTKRFGGALQSGQLLEVELVRAKGSSLSRLEAARILDPHLGLLVDVARLGEAALALRALREQLPEGDAEPALFDETCTYLDELARDGASTLRLVAFRLRLVDHLGLGPELEECVRCKKRAAEKAAYVNPRLGGLVCRACGGGGLVIGAGARALARKIRSGETLDLLEIEVSEEVERLGSLLEALAQHHTVSRKSIE